MSDSAPSLFQTTLWTDVIGAAAGPAGKQQALDELCRRYWHPLYVYTLGMGYSHADAEDATQAFFAKLLETRALLSRADRTRGRFRSYLLTSYKYFLADQYAKNRTQRRGGGALHFSFEENTPSELGPASCVTQGPERDYDRQWANVLVERATESLRQDYTTFGKAKWFERLGGANSSAMCYAELAIELESTPDAIKAFVSRMKRRFRLALEREVAATVADATELKEEMAYLAALLKEN